MGALSDDAVFRIMMRKLAPNIKNLFDATADKWQEMFFNIYLTGHFKEAKDFNNPDNVMLTMRSILSGKSEALQRDPKKLQNDEAILLEDMFPVFTEIMLDKAKTWGCSIMDLFISLRYKNGAEISEDTIIISIKTRKGCAVQQSEDL